MKKNVSKSATMKSAKAQLSVFPIVGVGASAGLGLAIAKSLFEMQNGRITAESAGQEKETQQKAKTPVIALTAHAGQEDIKRVLDAGFSAHIAKPVEKTLLSNVIKKLTST